MQFSLRFDGLQSRIFQPYQATSATFANYNRGFFRASSVTGTQTPLRSGTVRHDGMGAISKTFLERTSAWRTTFSGVFARYSMAQFSNPVVNGEPQYETISTSLHQNDFVIRKRFNPVLTGGNVAMSNGVVPHGMVVIPFIPSADGASSQLFMAVVWSNWLQQGGWPALGDVIVWYFSNGKIVVGRCRVAGRFDADEEYDLSERRQTLSESEAGEPERWLYSRFDAISTGEILVTGPTQQHVWEIGDGRPPFPNARFGFHFYGEGTHHLQIFRANFANTGFYHYEPTMLRENFRGAGFVHSTAHAFLGTPTATPTVTLVRATDLQSPINASVDTAGLYQRVDLPAGHHGSAAIVYARSALAPSVRDTSDERSQSLNDWCSSVRISASLADPFASIQFSLISHCESGSLSSVLPRALELQYRACDTVFGDPTLVAVGIEWLLNAPTLSVGNQMSYDEIRFDGSASIIERLNSMITDPLPLDGMTLSGAIEFLLDMCAVAAPSRRVQTNSLVLPYAYGDEQPTTAPEVGISFAEYIESLLDEFAPSWEIAIKPRYGGTGFLWVVEIGDRAFLATGNICSVSTSASAANAIYSLSIETIETEANELFVSGYNERLDQIMQERRFNSVLANPETPVASRARNWAGFRQVVGVANSRLRHQSTVKAYSDALWPLISRTYEVCSFESGLLLLEASDPTRPNILWVGDVARIPGVPGRDVFIEDLQIEVNAAGDDFSVVRCTYTGRVMN